MNQVNLSKQITVEGKKYKITMGGNHPLDEHIMYKGSWYKEVEEQEKKNWEVLQVGPAHYRLKNITKVRRLSDHFEFTIGNTIKSTTGDEKGEIVDFMESNENLWVILDTGDNLELNTIKYVAKKECEIIAFRDKEGLILKADEKSNVVDGGLTINYHLNRGDDIFTIRRLSDMIEFSIGDNTQLGEIEYFIDNINGMCAGIENVDCGSYHIMKLKKQPKKAKLFTTEDGVDVYESDNNGKTFYNVTVINKDFKILGVAGKEDSTYPNDNYLYFSTKEAAEKYIIENKQCLSLKDLNDLRIRNIYSSRLLEDAEILVKSRLK